MTKYAAAALARTRLDQKTKKQPLLISLPNEPLLLIKDREARIIGKNPEMGEWLQNAPKLTPPCTLKTQTFKAINTQQDATSMLAAQAQLWSSVDQRHPPNEIMKMNGVR